MTDVTSGPDGAVLQRLFLEAKDVLGRQLESIRGVEARAADFARLDGLVLGLLVAAAPLGAKTVAALGRPPALALGIGAAGICAIVASMVLALLAHRIMRYAIGLGGQSLAEALRVPGDERQFLERAVEGLAVGIDHNAKALDRKARSLEVSLWTLLVGLLFLCAGSTALIVAAVST